MREGYLHMGWMDEELEANRLGCWHIWSDAMTEIPVDVFLMDSSQAFGG